MLFSKKISIFFLFAIDRRLPQSLGWDLGLDFSLKTIKLLHFTHSSNFIRRNIILLKD